MTATASPRMHVRAQGSGDPILFIHGIPTSGELWSGVISQLHDRFTCFTVDLPGLGKTPRNSRSLGQPHALAAQIEEMRAARGIDKWHVVGHDAGSAIAVHYAFRYPTRVARLALLSPALFPDLRPFYLFELLRRPVIGEVLAPAVSLLFWKVAMRYAVEGRMDEMAGVVTNFREPFSGMRGAWRLMSVLRWGDPRTVLAPIPAFLPQLYTPTLIFHGARDAALPVSFAQRACALIPRSKLLVLDAGHFIPLNQPGRVAWELGRFFADERTRRLD